MHLLFCSLWCWMLEAPCACPTHCQKPQHCTWLSPRPSWAPVLLSACVITWQTAWSLLVIYTLSPKSRFVRILLKSGMCVSVCVYVYFGTHFHFDLMIRVWIIAISHACLFSCPVLFCEWVCVCVRVCVCVSMYVFAVSLYLIPVNVCSVYVCVHEML